MIYLTKIFQSALCQLQNNTWQRNIYSTSLIVSRLLTVCRWRTNGQWKCWHSILLEEPLPTEDLHKILADLCLLFQASCVNTWNHLSSLTNELNRWTILELEPTLLRTLLGIFGQFSSVVAMQHWNWQFKSAILESDKLNSSAEPFHLRVYHHKLTTFKVSWANWDSSNRQKLCTAVLGSWIITGPIFTG